MIQAEFQLGGEPTHPAHVQDIWYVCVCVCVMGLALPI